MKYHCPNCVFGNLMPTKIAYVRLLGKHLVTMPNFAAWHCDSCGYTRYDSYALAQLEMLLGSDSETTTHTSRWHTRQTEGPGERGPRRWTI